MAIVTRKLRNSQINIGGTQFEDRCSDFKLNNETDDGETFHTYNPTASFVEAAEDSYNLELKFYADWTSGGITRFLWDHDGETVTYQIDHHVDLPGEHVRFVGEVLIKAPTVGGEIRTTELTETTLVCTGKPTITYP